MKTYIYRIQCRVISRKTKQIKKTVVNWNAHLGYKHHGKRRVRLLGVHPLNRSEEWNCWELEGICFYFICKKECVRFLMRYVSYTVSYSTVDVSLFYWAWLLGALLPCQLTLGGSTGENKCIPALPHACSPVLSPARSRQKPTSLKFCYMSRIYLVVRNARPMPAQTPLMYYGVVSIWDMVLFSCFLVF